MWCRDPGGGWTGGAMGPDTEVQGLVVSVGEEKGGDVVLCVLAMIVALPIMGVIAVITYFDVGSPVLFKQQRIGKDCKPFTITKFKNMTDERDENGELLIAELRVTKIGRMVRRTSLDELTQLFHIIKGALRRSVTRPLLTQSL